MLLILLIGVAFSNEERHEFLPKKNKVMLCLSFIWHLTSGTLLTRWSALVLKVGVPSISEAFKEWLTVLQ